MRPSGLKPPSRIPASTGLLEMTASENNARSMMPPPRAATQSLKHKGSALPEPAPKRKTLAERAGEPHAANASQSSRQPNGSTASSHQSTTSSSRQVNGSIVRATSVRNPSSAASTASSRTASSRNPSMASTSISSRPTSAASSYRQPPAPSHVRPRTAMSSMPPPPVPQDECDSDDEQSASLVNTKRKGMKTISSLHTSQSLENINITPRKQRNRHEVLQRPLSALCSVPPRLVSRTTSAETSSPSSLRNMSLSTAFRSLRLTSNISRADEEQGQVVSFPLQQEEPQCPKTPSYIPKPVVKTPLSAAGLQPVAIDPSLSHCRFVQSPAPTPVKTVFLTRDSNLLAPAWDTKGRLEDMEVLYSQLKSQLDSASKENHGMEDRLGIHKARSMYVRS